MEHRFNTPKWTKLSPVRNINSCPQAAPPQTFVARDTRACANVSGAWLRLSLIAIALAWIAQPAQATVITINIDYIERDLNIVCQPCGPSTITFNFDNDSHVLNWTFDWYGWTGMAHDAYASAVANGADLFDLAENDPTGLDTWLIDHPNGVAFSRLDNSTGLGAIDSNWAVSLYNLGDLQTTKRDFLEVGLLDGFWRTEDVEDNSYYQSYFKVTGVGDEAPSPSPVPEPESLSLFLAAAAIGWGRRVVASLNR